MATNAQQIIFDAAANAILADPKLCNNVVFGDGGFRVVGTVALSLNINQSQVPVKFSEGFYPLSEAAQDIVKFDSALQGTPNPLLMEGLGDLQTEDGAIVFKRPTTTTKKTGGGCLGLLLIIVLFFGGFILLAPPLLSFMLNLMSGPMQSVATNILCRDPNTQQEIVQVVRAEMRVSGTRSSSSGTVPEGPVVTTNTGVEYLAAGDACSTPSAIKTLPASGILFTFDELNKPYLITTRPVTMLGQTTRNIEKAVKLTPEQARHAQGFLNQGLSESQITAIQNQF